MEKAIRYLLDTSGENSSNAVVGESHHLEDRRHKCLVTKEGSFYADSISLFQKDTGYKLIHKKDYVYSDIDIDLSITSGQTVANVLIILNYDLKRDFIVNYQATGKPRSESNIYSVQLLQAPETLEISDSYIDVKNKPVDFDPTFHYHPLSDIENFHELLFALDKVRNAVLMNSSQPIRQFLLDVEAKAQNLISTGQHTYESYIEIEFQKFKESFTKANWNLDKLHNIATMKPIEGRKIGANQLVDANPEGYFDMEALVSYKTALYNTYVGSDTTNIGRSLGQLTAPLLNTILGLETRKTVIFDSYSNNVNHEVPFDRMAYPSLKLTTQIWYITKIVNSPDMRSGVALAIEAGTNRTFTGVLTRSNVGISVSWREMQKPTGLTDSIDAIGKHLTDYFNPHKDTKDHVNLGKVENLPLATLFDILTEKTDRKYLTWTLLDRFTRKLLLKHRPNKTEQLETADVNVMRNISVVFSPCGQSCSSNDCVVFDPIKEIETTTTTTTTTTTNDYYWAS